MARPNVLLITTDQQHPDTLGIENPRIRTPALDRLAREGTRFSRAYCSNSLCTPARASIITGLWPSQHQGWTLGVKLPEDVPTLGAILMANGYDTALVGKAHFQPLRTTQDCPSIESHPILRDLDFWRKFRGPWYGFRHLELARNHADEAHVGQHYAIWMEEKGLKGWARHFCRRGERQVPERRHAWDLPEAFHYTTWTGERSIAWLEEKAKAREPFFLWASFQDPHPPYLVSEPWASMYDPKEMVPGRLQPGESERWPPHLRMTQEENPDFSAYRETFGVHGLHSHRHEEAGLRKDIAVYYGMLSFVDREIGRILAALDRLGLADDTIVLFTTDHGHFLGQHGLVAKGPFHFEDLIRIPMIVRWPGRVPAGARSEALQSQVDFAPTFLSAAGIPVPRGMQGLDQTPVWTGRAGSVRDSTVVENRSEPTAMHLRTYVERRHKITVYRNAEFGELFDLESDPGETRNLWDDPAARALRSDLLHRFLRADMAREPLRMPRIARA